MHSFGRIFGQILKTSRDKVYKLFVEQMAPRKGDVVINLGAAGDCFGEPPFFESNYEWKENIIGVNINRNELAGLKKRYREVSLVLADGCSLPFKSKSVEILFSNAVIEHVGDLNIQKEFASEITRISKKWFVTTPNFWFPIETHWKLPIIHFLPMEKQKQIMDFGKERFVEKPHKFLFKLPPPIHRLFRRYFVNHGWFGQGLYLLDSAKLKKLFPTSKIKKQRTTFYPEVLIAYSKK